MVLTNRELGPFCALLSAALANSRQTLIHIPCVQLGRLHHEKRSDNSQSIFSFTFGTVWQIEAPVYCVGGGLAGMETVGGEKPAKDALK